MSDKASQSGESHALVAVMRRRVSVAVALVAVLGLGLALLTWTGGRPDRDGAGAESGSGVSEEIGPLRASSALVKVERRASAVDAAGKDTLWVLAVGSDARPGQNMLRSRGDALQLVGINTKTGNATLIGIPRDSWVPIPGHGNEKVNSALYFGGPQLLGETVGNMVGVQPEYVFVTRFKGMWRLIDGIGGIDVYNPRAFSDQYLRPNGFKAGWIHLDGPSATAFGRIRKSLPGGDFDRSANQQRVLRGIQRKVMAKQNDVGFIAKGVVSVTRNMYTDLPVTELYRLAQVLAKVRPGHVSTCVVPGGIGTSSGGASIVVPDLATAKRYGRDARVDGTIKRC